MVCRKAALEEERERASRIASLPPPAADPVDNLSSIAHSRKLQHWLDLDKTSLSAWGIG